MLVDHPCPDRPVKCANVVENFVTFVSGQIRIEHHVTNLAVGLQIFFADSILRFFGRTANMRGQNNVL